MSKKVVLQLANKLKILSRPQSVREAQCSLKDANQQWKELKKKASSFQDTFLEWLAEARAKEGDTRKEGELKSTCLQEQQRKSSAQI